MSESLIKSFQLTKVLENNTTEKSISLLGKINSQDAIIRLERLLLTPDSLIEETEIIEKIDQNDIYSWFKSQNSKINLIYPATEKHVSKYQTQNLFTITETPKIYNEIILPYIKTMKGSRIQWVKDILFHGAEASSVIYKDSDPNDGFILLPDMKWDRTSIDNLYIILIVYRQDISSIRDLNGSHIDWLINLKEKTFEEIGKKYKLKEKNLKLFVHYHPSYYHFHIHIINVNYKGIKNGINSGKAILLDDIIENLKLDKNAYEKRIINYEIGENHDIYKLLNKDKVI